MSEDVYHGNELIKFLEFLNFTFETNVQWITMSQGNLLIKLQEITDDMLQELLLRNLIEGVRLRKTALKHAYPSIKGKSLQDVWVVIDVTKIDSRLGTRINLEKCWGLQSLPAWIDKFKQWIPQ